MSDSNFAHDVACASVAGLVSRIPCHPLDTCKTIAAAAEGAHESVLSTARMIYQREGVKGFYRGIGIAGLGAAPGVALYISTYEYLKTHVFNNNGITSDTSPVIHLAAGFGAETVSCVVWLPIDVVKERLQTQGPEVKERYVNSIDGLIRVAKYEGLRGLYKGYFLTLGSFGPFSAVYFASFEATKALFFGLAPSDHASGSQSFFCGAASNAVACVITQPLEVVKTRYQIQRARLNAQGTEFKQYAYAYHGMIDGLRTILKNEGIFGLWRGVCARIAYTAPNAALTFSMYGALKSYTSSRTVATTAGPT